MEVVEKKHDNTVNSNVNPYRLPQIHLIHNIIQDVPRILENNENAVKKDQCKEAEDEKVAQSKKE